MGVVYREEEGMSNRKKGLTRESRSPMVCVLNKTKAILRLPSSRGQAGLRQYLERTASQAGVTTSVVVRPTGRCSLICVCCMQLREPTAERESGSNSPERNPDMRKVSIQVQVAYIG